jgi:hypothetical protein
VAIFIFLIRTQKNVFIFISRIRETKMINRNYKVIEEVTLTYSKEDSDRVLKWLNKKGFRIISGGPKRIDARTRDMTKFYMRCQRTIGKGTYSRYVLNHAPVAWA